MKFGRRLLLAGAFVVTAAFCASTPVVPAEDPFEINVILPMTGGGAFLGKQDAATLAIIESRVNKTDGIKGRPIKFHIYDDQSNPQIAVELTNQLKAKNVAVILGTQLVGGCNAMAPLVKDGPVVYCYSPSIYPESGSYMFSGNIASRDMVAVSVRYFRERGWKKVGVLNPTDATGQDADRSVDAVFADRENRGMAVVAREHFNLSDLSVAAQMSRIKAAGAQAMIVWVTGTQLSTALHGALDAGVADVPLMTSTGNLLYAQLDSLSSVIGENVLFPATPGDAPDALPAGELRTTVTAYQDAVRAAGLRPDQGATLAWDPTWIVIDALRKFGTSATPAQIRSYIAGLRGYTGVNGVYDFQASPQRGLNASSVIMVRWVKDKGGWISVSRPGGALPK
jgi:branched-chain amino acid transport system substrate-binding protein